MKNSMYFHTHMYIHMGRGGKGGRDWESVQDPSMEIMLLDALEWAGGFHFTLWPSLHLLLKF